MTTRFTCHGGAPVRWTVGPSTELDRALCELEDAAFAYRVPDELRSIQGLERRGENFRLDMLLRLARIRRRLLGSRLREAAAPFDGRELVSELAEIGTLLRGWMETTRISPTTSSSIEPVSSTSASVSSGPWKAW